MQSCGASVSRLKLLRSFSVNVNSQTVNVSGDDVWFLVLIERRRPSRWFDARKCPKIAAIVSNILCGVHARITFARISNADGTIIYNFIRKIAWLKVFSVLVDISFENWWCALSVLPKITLPVFWFLSEAKKELLLRNFFFFPVNTFYRGEISPILDSEWIKQF